MSSSDSIFEIREYLDNDGKVSGHDVTDISKELEYMEKLVNSVQESAPALNEEDQFIRELALLAQQQEEEPMDEGVVDDNFFDSFEAKESVTETKKALAESKKASATGEKPKSGWGKGFLSKSQPTSKKASVAKPAAESTSTTQSIENATEQMSISDATNTKLKASSPVAVEPTVPLKGILKHSTPITTAAPISGASTNSQNNTSETTMPNTAFSGGIVERAPVAKTVTKLGTGSNIILGPKKKHT